MNKEEKCSFTQKGRIVIHKGDSEKRIYLSELEAYLKDGWEKGVSEKHKKSNGIAHKGKPAPNKGQKLSSKTKAKLSEALRGRTPWNAGLTKETSESVAKQADTQRGKSGNRLGQHNSPEHNAKISKAHTGKHFTLSKEKLLIKTSKEYLTKKKNNSFNTSKPEEELYEKLLHENTNKTIYRQYKDEERYPFYCDFYIVEDDLFIELNAHWSHGGKPFDSANEECLQQLAVWQEKARTSQFYKNAIETWTVRDVEKAKYAKNNNLNYLVIY